MELVDKYPDIDPQYINFVNLHHWICELEEFDDDPERSGEKILEAIQAAWIEEAAE
jgi:FeS assembly protein IscX|tara:strand:+ start:6071 stop:6238 length:168 start_codon:yes stop_codon:yes gene_type:complete